jgi:hypothetical protein
MTAARSLDLPRDQQSGRNFAYPILPIIVALPWPRCGSAILPVPRAGSRQPDGGTPATVPTGRV